MSFKKYSLVKNMIQTPSLGKKEQKRIKYWRFLPKDVHVLQVWKVHIVGWSKRINWFCEKNIDIDKVSNGLQLIWITQFFIFYLLLTCFWSEFHTKIFFQKEVKMNFPLFEKEECFNQSFNKRERGGLLKHNSKRDSSWQ